MSVRISRDEWLAALVEIGEDHATDDRESVTTTEFMAMMGMDRQTARRRLEKLVTTGKAERTFKRERLHDGRTVRANGYKLLVP